MPEPQTILDRVYDHEAAQPGRIFLTQPVGGDAAVDFTWGEALDEARRMATHLRSLGLEPGGRVALLTKNCAHFLMAELAIWIAGGTTVAIFPTEAADNLRYVLEHSEARLLFVGKLDQWPEQAPGVPAGLPCIALPLAPAAALLTFPRWDDIVARSAPLAGRPRRKADDLAMLCYTSGSTGQPKGVMHAFGRITQAAQCGLADPDMRLPEGVPRRTLSYLPLAHIYERAVVACRNLIAGDGRIYFSESLETFADDIRRARPTVFASVPRLWLKFQQGVFKTLPPDQLDARLTDPATATATAHRVLASLGLDEVRIASVGSAPMPPPLLAWYRRLGLNLIEGYGMTEDFGYSHHTTPLKNAPGHVGTACPGVQVRIADDGEVLIKSPGQMVGYYKQPELNAACFTADGFYRTGDLGELSADGQLKLTGRVKELFKTAKGKYVAPAPIEMRLNAHPMVEQAIVSGVGQPQPYALVVLPEGLRAQLGDADLRARVEAAMTALLRDVNQALAAHERLDRLVIAHEPWSVDNGCLTPTMKIKRSRIEASVATAVDAWYAAPGPVLWA
jgi:long-chain acyl-CoA synthetase